MPSDGVGVLPVDQASFIHFWFCPPPSAQEPGGARVSDPLFGVLRTTSDPHRPLYRWKARSGLFPVVHTRATRAHADERKTHRHAPIFFRHSCVARGAVDGWHGAGDAAIDAQAGGTSPLNVAATLLRHLSRLGRRLAAPDRLAATCGSCNVAARRDRRR